MEGYGKKNSKIFLTRVKLQPFGGNYKHDKKFEKIKWMCCCGGKLEEESHLLSGECPVYGDMVAMVDDQLVAFFAAVLERRKQLEQLEEQPSRHVVTRTSQYTCILFIFGIYITVYCLNWLRNLRHQRVFWPKFNR